MIVDKRDRHVHIEYPERPRSHGVLVELIDVRAANALRVSFDFERDGWVLEMEREAEQSDPYLIEVGFVSAWKVE